MRKELSPDDIRQFAELIGDDNPLHHDDEAARKLGLPGVIAPGVMVLSFVSAAVAAQYENAMVRSLSVKFLEPMVSGMTPKVTLIPSGGRERLVRLAIKVIGIQDNQADAQIADGSCVIVLPND